MTSPQQSGMNLGNAYGQIVIDSSGVQRGVQEAQRIFNNGIQSMGRSIENFGTQIQNLGANLTLLTAPILGMGVAGVRTAATFEDAMAEIAARTGLTGEALDTIRDKALQMGADTKFSAQDAADGFLQLLASGSSVEEAMIQIEAVMMGAAAAGSDLGFTADGLTDIMAAMGLEASESVRVMDALIDASGSSSASFEDLIAGFSNVGPVARNFGLSVEDVAATLAVFSENGIKGSEAGTQLRSMLNNMTRDTEDVRGMWEQLGVSMFDAEGNARNLNDIIADLNVAMEGMSDQERTNAITTLAGTYGQMGLSALLATGGIDEMQAAMASQSDFADIATERMGTFNGAMDSLKGSIETLMITAFTPFIEMLTPLIQQVIGVVNAFTEWVAANQAVVQPILQVMAVLIPMGPALFAIGTAISAFGGILSTIGAALAFIVSPIGLIIAAVVALGAAWATNFMGIQETLQPIIDGIQAFASQVVTHINGIWTAFQEGGLSNAASYVYDNIITPLVNAVASVDWSAVGTSILNAIGTALQTLGTWATWAYDNILLPLWNNFTTAVQSIDWGQVGLAIINAVGTALQLAADFGVWIYDNILIPLVSNAQTAIESIDWFSVGSGIVNAIGSILKTTFDFVAWIIDSIFSPITSNTDAATGQVDWSGVGTSLLSAIGNFLRGAFDFIQWLMDNVLSPLILGAADAIGRLDWSSIGTNLMESIANALPNIVQWVHDNIIAPIQNALANFDPMGAINQGASNIQTFFNQVGGALGWAEGGIVGYAGGGMVEAIVGERGPERVTLPVGSQVHATSSGNTPSIGTLVIQANSEAQGAAGMRGALAEWDKVMNERNFQ
jgi:TP901 family phage tail tape measure protein